MKRLIFIPIKKLNVIYSEKEKVAKNDMLHKGMRIQFLELLWSDVFCEACETSTVKQFRAVKRRPIVSLLTKYIS